MKHKKLVSFIIILLIICLLPFLFLLMRNNYMIFGYWIMAFIYLLIGLAYINLRLVIIKGIESIILITVFFICAICLYFYSTYILEFNYGIAVISVMLPLLLPYLLLKCFKYYLLIPLPFYQSFEFPIVLKDNLFELSNYPLVVRLYIIINKEDILIINTKSSKEFSFGDWFVKAINDYNVKFPLKKIEISTNTKIIKWCFYKKRYSLFPYKRIDHTKTFYQNKIEASDKILAYMLVDNLQQH